MSFGPKRKQTTVEVQKYEFHCSVDVDAKILADTLI
jgi:hypothetical protein